jgi:hypothetical protein
MTHEAALLETAEAQIVIIVKGMSAATKKNCANCYRCSIVPVNN